MADTETTFYCGRHGCDVDVREHDAMQIAREQSEAWARQIEREAFALTGKRGLFPEFLQQGVFLDECYDAEIRRRALAVKKGGGDQFALWPAGSSEKGTPP